MATIKYVGIIDNDHEHDAIDIRVEPTREVYVVDATLVERIKCTFNNVSDIQLREMIRLIAYSDVPIDDICERLENVIYFHKFFKKF